MNLSNKANLIIYRFREKGLEVFLVSPDKKSDNWEIPQGPINDEQSQHLLEEDRLIELDPVQQESGDLEGAWAVEGDWHEIPSLKGMLYEDAKYLKDRIMDMGAFFVVKEAFKKVLPHQYQYLKELKDILADRNSVKDI